MRDFAVRTLELVRGGFALTRGIAKTVLSVSANQEVYGPVAEVTNSVEEDDPFHILEATSRSPCGKGLIRASSTERVAQ